MIQTYAVECYWPGVDEAEFGAAVARLEDVEAVSWISVLLIPDDEIVLCFADAWSSDVVRRAAHQSGLPAERAVRCIHVALRPRAAQGE